MENDFKSDRFNFYRAGETLPLKNLSLQDLDWHLRSIKKASDDRDIQPVPLEHLVGLLSKEGRTDFGYNGTWDYNNPVIDSVYGQYKQQGMSTIPAIIMEKQRKSQQNKRDFFENWNGLGINYKGISGAEYAKDIRNKHFSATHDPRNKQIVDFIKARLAGKPYSPSEEFALGYNKGDDLLNNALSQSALNKLMKNDKDIIRKELIRRQGIDNYETRGLPFDYGNPFDEPSHRQIRNANMIGEALAGTRTFEPKKEPRRIQTIRDLFEYIITR